MDIKMPPTSSTERIDAAHVIKRELPGTGVVMLTQHDDEVLTFWHATVGANVVARLSLLLVGVGRLGWVPGRTLWLTAAVAGLVVVQSLLVAPYHMASGGLLRAVARLHVVNGLLIFCVVFRLLERRPR